MIIGLRYVPLERISPRVHLRPSQRCIGNWIGIADVLFHSSDYEPHSFEINTAWLAGMPLVCARRYRPCARSYGLIVGTAIEDFFLIHL